MKTPIKQVLLSILLLQTTCQVLPTETAGEQAQTLSATLWQNTKDGLGYLGQQTLNGMEAGVRYCGNLALQGAKATGNFAWEQAQERPYLATGIVAGLAIATYCRQGIKHRAKIINEAINKHPKKSMLVASLASLTSGVLFNEEIKNGLKAAGSYAADTISSYLPSQTNS